MRRAVLALKRARTNRASRLFDLEGRLFDLAGRLFKLKARLFDLAGRLFRLKARLFEILSIMESITFTAEPIVDTITQRGRTNGSIDND